MSQDLQQEFHNTGFLHIKSVIDKNTCVQLIARMRDLVERYADRKKSNSKIFDTDPEAHTSDEHFLRSARNISFFFDKNHRNDASIFKSLNKVGHALHDRCPVYARFSHQQQFYNLAHELGHYKPRLIQSMFIFKQPFFGDRVPAHQDASFLYSEPQSVIGLWFALQDADENNGCLWVLPGGHKGPLKERFMFKNQRLIFDGYEKVCWPAHKFRPLKAQAGDMIVLHGLLPHCSEQNRSNKTRFAYTLHFVDARSHFPRDNWLSNSW